jgi:glutathione S-transferase
MKLYFNPRSRATVAKWMLDEVGAPYETVHIDFEKKEHKAPEFLAINPAGKLPALVDGESRLFENVAIGLYLGDKFPEAKLAPPIGSPARGRYLSLMVYATSQLEPAMGDTMMKIPHHPSRGWTTFDEARVAVERELGDKPYLLEQGFTLADVMIGSPFLWKRRFGGPPESPKLEEYMNRLIARPAAASLRG